MLERNYIEAIRLKQPIDDGSYLSRLPALRHLVELESLPLTSRVTFLVGENGSGKSTLLEAIAIASGFNAEGGTRNFRFSTARSHSQLYEHLTLVKSKHPRDGFFPTRRELFQCRELHRRNRSRWQLRRRLVTRAIARRELLFADSKPLRRQRAVLARRARGRAEPIAATYADCAA